MTAPEDTGSETTRRLLEQSRELLKDLSERLSGEPDDTSPVEPG